MPPHPTPFRRPRRASQNRKRKLANCWRLSPYFLEPPKPAPVGVDAEIARYSDKYRKRAKARGWEGRGSGRGRRGRARPERATLKP